MGYHPSAHFIFGVLIPAETILPWEADEDEDDEFDSEIDNWYMKFTGFKQKFEVYDSQGDYLEGFTKDSPEVDEYFKEQRDWKKAHKLPVECHYFGHMGEWREFERIISPIGMELRADYDAVKFSMFQNLTTVELYKFLKEHEIKHEKADHYLIASYG